MNTDSKSPTALGEGGISPRAEAVVQKRRAASETRAWAGLFKGKSPEDAHARAAQLDAEAAALAAEPPEQSLVVGTGGEIAIHPSEAQGYFDTIQSRPDAIAVDASRHRVSLAREAGVVALALDAAETVQAANSMEKMLAHQIAATHKAGMDLVILAACRT